MRSCLRCNGQMVENLEIKTTEAMGIGVGEKGIFKGSLGKIVCAACPYCGYTETYLENTDKLKNLVEKKSLL